jgi:hypothetical protein
MKGGLAMWDSVFLIKIRVDRKGFEQGIHQAYVASTLVLKKVVL